MTNLEKEIKELNINYSYENDYKPASMSKVDYCKHLISLKRKLK